MALPNTRKDTAEKTEAETVTVPVSALVFEEPVEEMPGVAFLNQVTNPYQEVVNKMAQDPRGHDGPAQPVVVEEQDVKDQCILIRRAASNIGKGARTKWVPIKDGQHKGKARIYFTIGRKIVKTRAS